MPRQKNPAALARITGADQKNPQRYADEVEHKLSPIGLPPERLNEFEREAWHEYAADLPWLCKSDRLILELTCRLTARLRTDPEMGINALAQLRLCLTSLGATPTTRGKVSVSDEDKDDPANEFLQ